MIITPSTPSTCPGCGLIEDKIEVCRHCRREYEYAPAPFWVYILIPMVIVVALIVIFGLGALVVKFILFPMLDFIFEL